MTTQTGRLASVGTGTRFLLSDLLLRFRLAEMKARMTNGNPEAPLLLYVGRLGAGACVCMRACVCTCVCARMSVYLYIMCNSCRLFVCDKQWFVCLPFVHLII
jgi:hypothetical protein